MKKILFAGAEVMPFAASGGLGDVLGSLPAALKAAGNDVDVRVAMPLYSIIPEKYRDMTVLDAEADIDAIASKVDFVFCAVNMDKAKIRALEETYAKKEIPVVSNNSAHRFTPDVPMVIPEINPEHVEIIQAQKARLGTKRGFIAVKSNCSLQSYVPL